ncbi:O-linked N-acetylglucosamine transferase, SPINDLY family protein [Candidatus Pelagibacter sp. HIMB1509]|uniref:O-linked N-acetylglucosamine transferase, SPINDLY family protein n=1 Tax=Candidatus Pelagibacter sp. HIMB1509 TaxID=3413339 RepID=UPI003F8410B2
MSDLDKDLVIKLQKFLTEKQFKRLKYEVDVIGEIKDQHPLIIFYYASSIALNINSDNEDLLYAEELFEKVYLLRNDLQSLYNMIAISFKTKCFKRVFPHILKEYEKNSKDNNLIEGIAKINFFLGNNVEAIKYFKIFFDKNPNSINYLTSFISAFNYISDIDQKNYLKVCEKYLKPFVNNIKYDKLINPKENKKIKIGFLSGDLKTHSVSFFLKGLISNINKEKFEIIFFSNLDISEYDDYTIFFKSFSNQWFDIFSLEDDLVIEKIRSLNLDVLIDLSGFFKGNRLQVIVNRCAKIQIGWLGYNNSLGIKNLDYLIADPNLVKSDEQNQYYEKILFLPKIWNAMSIPKDLPNINVIKDTNKNIFSFGSFNNYQKLSNETIKVWSKILLDTNSQIYLKSSIMESKDIKENILNKFFQRGVKNSQVIFLDRTDKISDHLKLYYKIDLALDTFPYPGVTTSFEAILMGVPVLTMRGFNLNSRCGESILKNIALPELIAQDKNDYYEKAIHFMNKNNLNKVSGLKLREKAISSPLFDTVTFAKNFENIIEWTYNKIEK